MIAFCGHLMKETFGGAQSYNEKKGRNWYMGAHSCVVGWGLTSVLSGFASHGGSILSWYWLIMWKPLDVPGTQLPHK